MSKIIKFVRVQDMPVVIEPCYLSEQKKINNDQSAQISEQIIIDAEKEATRLLNEARNRADILINEAQDLYEKLKKEAFELGYQEGYQQGLKQARQDNEVEMQDKLHEAIEQAERLLTAAQREYQQTMINAERHIVELALTVARKILVRELDENPTVVLPIVRAALEKVRDQEQVTIRVNPEDFEVVLEAKRDLEYMIGRERALQIISDNTVSRGGCLLDTLYGTVDARIDSQFEIIKGTLEDLLP